MRHIHLAVFLFGALLLPGRLDAQRVPGATTVRPPGGGEPVRVATPSRTPATRGLPDDRSPARHSPASAVRGTSSVTLVLVPSLPDGAEDARAVVLRRARQNPQNVILVTSATTAADLTQAVAALFNSRRGQGDKIDRDLMARIAPAGVAPTRALPAAQNSAAAGAAPPTPPRRNVLEAERQLSMLRTAPVMYVDGVGAYPVRVVRLGRLRQ